MTLSPPRQNRNVTWNPSDYAANSASQLVWARELIARIELRGDENILDVGCGDGKVTADLARAVPQGLVVGIDSAPEMIRFATENFSGPPFANLEFKVMDARQIHFHQPFDLVVSNAALHWVDDHPAFLRGVAACLRDGGRLVVSCGGCGNAQEVFVALRGVMRLKQWRQFFRRLAAPYFFHRPEDYERWLPGHGLSATSINLSPKYAVHETADAFAAWLRTTWMPYTQRVPEAWREEFIAAVVSRYLMKKPVDAQGRVHVRMVRLEMDAVKAVRRIDDDHESEVCGCGASRHSVRPE